jgi:histidinol-phosphate aminotransferase
VVRRVSSPYNVNAAALACLPVALADRDYIAQYVSEVRQSRTRLQRTLEASGVQFWPSQANFVLMRVGATQAQASAFVEHMRQHGILVRDRSSDLGCEGCVRITLGPKAHLDRLLAALRETLADLGIAQGVART